MFQFQFVMISASLLRELRHANIVTLHDIVHEQNSLIFVFEYMVIVYIW